MFKIYKKNCCGLDVHKTWIYACIGITDDQGRTVYFRDRFSAFKKGLNELVDFLAEHGCKDVCMESSGRYWIPVHNVLENCVNVVLAHPKYTKPMTGKKSDVRDAKWICDLFMCDMIEPSFIPEAPIRSLRDLMRYRTKQIHMRNSEKNRALNCLTACNIKLDDVFSDVFGKSSRSIINELLEHPGNDIDVAPLLDKRCARSAEEITEAIRDCELTLSQKVKLTECLNFMDEADERIARVEERIREIANAYQGSLDLIRTIPGFGRNDMTAITILSEIGDDMSVFPNAKHLTSWAGCCPRPDSSARRVKRSGISHAGSNLKPTLVQVSLSLVRSKAHPEFGIRYRRLKARRGHKKAIIAICRMLLVAVWHVLKKGEPYTDKGYLKPTPKAPVEISKDEAIKLLLKKGYVIKDGDTPTGEASA